MPRPKLRKRQLEERRRQMRIQSELDSHAYKHRVADAIRHSQYLSRSFPVAVTKPTWNDLITARSPESVLRARKEARNQPESRETYQSLLSQLDAAEYSEPERKRLKTEGQVAIKEDQVAGIKKQNENLFRKLQKELNGKKRSPLITRWKPTPRLQMAKNTVTKSEKTRPQHRFASQFQYETHQSKHQDEIEEIEDRLKAQRLSEALEKEKALHDSIATRETNTLVEQVLVDFIYDIAEESFDEEEESSKKKELPPDQLKVVVEALTSGPMDRVLIQKYSVDITRRHLQCLHPLQWLNDEIINFWFQLLNDRDEQLVKDGVLSKRSHFFNSFFYSKVSENGYNFINVRRWTRKFDIFAMDKVFVPVNISNTHWCLAVIFMTEKRIQYYDSMNGSGEACIKTLFKYLHDEMKHKKKQEFDEEGWELVTTEPDTPQQANGSDCGVFTSIFADYLSRDQPLAFSQKEMEFHRHRMALHVIQGFLPVDEEL